MRPLDVERTEALAAEIMVAIRTHYTGSSYGDRVAVLEVLNALGSVAALVIKGTEGDPRAIEFFQRALRIELETGAFTATARH